MVCKLEITDISCMGCINTITTCLSRISGIISVNVDFKSKAATIEYDEKTLSVPDIISEIEDLGYTVKR